MRPARARESSRCGHSAAATPPTGRAGEREVDARDAAAAEVDGAAARAPRRAARGRRRSGGCRCGRRARGRAPGRGRCRSPRRCGARRRAGRRCSCSSRSSRPWVASAVSMWSRKPTPVAIAGAPAAVEVDAHVDGRLARAARRRAAPAPDAGRGRRRERRHRPPEQRGEARDEAVVLRRRGDRGADDAGQQRLVAEAADDEPARGEPGERLLAAPRGAEGDVVAGAAQDLEARARRCRRPAGRARPGRPRRRPACRPRGAQASSAARALCEEIEPGGRSASSAPASAGLARA